MKEEINEVDQKRNKCKKKYEGRKKNMKKKLQFLLKTLLNRTMKLKKSDT